MKIGSLFSGYSGLDQAVESFFNARTVWHSEIEEAPSKVLAKHYPGTPNHGDITKIQWGKVEPVDIITGGFPCQDLSTAGARRGLKDGTRSGLWAHMHKAIKILKPKIVVIENVQGLLSAQAETPSELEPCPWCVGDTADAGALRALGAVLGDLASIGYDAQWQSVRASDTGAPHRRTRVFIVAYPRGERAGGWADQPGDSEIQESDDSARRSNFGATRRDMTLLPTPQATNNENRQSEGYGPNLGAALSLLPTPNTMDHLPARGNVIPLLPTPNSYEAERGGSQHPDKKRAGGHQVNLSDVTEKELPTLLPTPKAGDADFGLPRTSGRPPEKSTHLATRIAFTDWGKYAPALRRWGQVIGREAPAPNQLSARGNLQLAPAFVEWMMGLPNGWVTDPGLGLSRAQQIKMLGNGVVPQQALLALQTMLGGGPDDAGA